jgi:hypothetical protein
MGGDNHDDCREPGRQQQWYGDTMILRKLLYDCLPASGPATDTLETIQILSASDCMKRVLQVVFETNAFGLLWDISNTALVKWTQDCRVVIWAEGS